VNGVDVTNARHDDVIRLLTSETCHDFTIVAYRDPDHPLSPSVSPRSQLFMPRQPHVNMTFDPASYPTSSAIAKRPSPGPQLRASTTEAGTHQISTASFVPRPASAEVGKFPSDSRKSPLAAVKTVTYSIGDPASASVEPPMPLMKMGRDQSAMSPRSSSSAAVDPVARIPSHDANLLFVTPPAPPRTSTGSGVSDLFDALEKTYHASQSGASDHSRASYDASVRVSATFGTGSGLPSTDKKRRSLEVRHCCDIVHYCNPFTALWILSGLPGYAGTRKVKSGR